jgi:hypothetical protein
MATSPKLNWAYYFQGASRDKRGRLPSTCVHKHVDLQPHVSEPFWYDIIFLFLVLNVHAMCGLARRLKGHVTFRDVIVLTN